MKKAFADNVNVDCTYYPDSAKYALNNNTNEVQSTRFFDRDGIERTVEMKPDEIVWISISEGESLKQKSRGRPIKKSMANKPSTNQRIAITENYKNRHGDSGY